jgi:hypothetical protein
MRMKHFVLTRNHVISSLEEFVDIIRKKQEKLN